MQQFVVGTRLLPVDRGNRFPSNHHSVATRVGLFSKVELLDDLKHECDALVARTQKRICQMIDAELQSCWLSAYFGYLRLRMGSVDKAEHEVGEVDKRCQTILNLLPDVADEVRRNQFQAELGKLLRALTLPGSPGPQQ